MKRIVLDCERMKYNHTGLYHYCLQLGTALKQEIDPAAEELIFYLREENKGIFGTDQNYLVQKGLHKVLLPVHNADVWHGTYQSTNYFPRKKNKLKILLTVHDLNLVHENRYSEKKLAKKLARIRKKAAAADHIAAISNFTRNDVVKYLGVPFEKITVIYNGCNFNKVENAAAPVDPPHGKFLFTIGTINAKKNFHVLPALLKDNEYVLVIAGITDNEDYKRSIINEAKKFNAENRLVFPGPVSENDKQWYLKNCTAFLFPSLAEGFGLPVIEAMHFGRPVFLSNLTALPEIGGEDAFYFDSFEPGSMRSVFAKGLRDFELSPVLGNNLRERAASFSWQSAAKKYAELYRMLTANAAKL